MGIGENLCEKGRERDRETERQERQTETQLNQIKKSGSRAGENIEEKPGKHII